MAQLKVNSTAGGAIIVTADNIQNYAAGAQEGIFWENDTIVSTNYTISSNMNAGTFGPVTIAEGVVVTVPDGSTWTIV